MFPADHIADGVYIGGARLLYYVDALREVQVTHVLKLYEDTPNWDWPADFTVFNNTITDGLPVPDDAFKRGVAFVQETVAAGQPILVACGAGISRSATFVLAYLTQRGDSLPAAWKLLKAQHSNAMPNPALWESLIAYYGLPFTLEDCLRDFS